MHPDLLYFTLYRATKQHISTTTTKPPGPDFPSSPIILRGNPGGAILGVFILDS